MRLCPLLLLAMALSACAPLRGSGPQFPSEPKAGDVFQGDAPWAYDGQRWIPLRNGYVGVDGCLTKYQGGMVLWKHCGRSADRLSAPTSKFLPPQGERHAEFYAWIKPRMTRERALRVRQLRVDDGWSYRRIAGVLYLEWGRDANWEPITNQLAGVALCEAAAELLGEEMRAWPWQANQA